MGLLSDEDLNDLLKQASRTRPVNPAAGEVERVDAALAGVWRSIESDAAPALRAGPTGRRVARRRLAAVGVAAVAVAAASLVGVESLTGGSGGAGLPLAVSPAAAAQLNRFAHAAAAQPALSAGQWKYVKAENLIREAIAAGSTTVNFTTRITTQFWFSADGTTRERETDHGASFLTPQDRANYEANKSAIARQFGGKDPTLARGVTADSVDPNQNGPRHVWQTSPPRDPQALLSEITASEPASLHDDPAYAWGAVGNVLLTSTSPQARSTAFAAMAYVPGAKVLGTRTDRLGRSGTAISFSDPKPTGGFSVSPVNRVTFIVDPSTGEILDVKQMLTAAHGPFPAGTVISQETFVQQGIVDSDSALPGGGSQPLPASVSTSTTGTTPTTPATSTTSGTTATTR